MTIDQFDKLLIAIKSINGGMPTWLSLLMGAILSIAGSIIFDVYKNYKYIEEVKTQIENVESRLINYLNFIIDKDDDANIRNLLLLDVNQKIEDLLVKLIELKDSIDRSDKKLNKVLINTIYIKEMVGLTNMKQSSPIHSETNVSVKGKAIEIKNAVNGNEVNS